MYAEDGTLLAEYGSGGSNSTGSAQYIYLPTASGPMPIAAILKGTAYAVHSDHLNTPRKLTQADGQVAWQWAYSAFGDEQPTLGAKRFTNETTTPTTGATSIPEVTFNLRYPGQYFDKETKLHYNHFRSYSPAMGGRYTQGDPIGLDGGWNRFANVDGNPLSYTDPKGLIRICTVPGGCVDTNPPSIDPELLIPPPITFPNPIKPILNFINKCLKDCDAERERAEAYCEKIYSSGYTPDRAGRRIGGKRFNQCVQGQISEACGENKVE